mgnify:CR=1 FL=1
MEKPFKISVAIILTALLLFLPGCWSHRELNEIGIVSAMGLDLNEEGKIGLSVQVITPLAEQANETGQAGKVRFLRTEGKTVFDAVRDMMTISGDRLFYPHNQVIVIGEELARSGIRPVLDFLERDPEIRLFTNIFVTEGRAERIIDAVSTEEVISAMHLSRLIENYGSVSKGIPVRLLDVLNAIYSEGIEVCIGKIDYKGEKGKPTFLLKGGGVFKDDKLVDWLDTEETRGFLWVHDKVESGIIVASNRNPQEKLEGISFEIIRAGSKIKPKLEGDKPSFTIEIKVTCNLGECMEHLPKTNEDYEELEKILGQAVIGEVQTIIDKAQKELGMDILGFGEALYRKFPAYWKEHKQEWAKIFPQTEVEIVVEALLANHGTLR